MDPADVVQHILKVVCSAYLAKNPLPGRETAAVLFQTWDL